MRYLYSILRVLYRILSAMPSYMYVLLLLLVVAAMAALVWSKRRWGWKGLLGTLLLEVVAAVCVVVYAFYLGFVSNPHNYDTIGDIRPPRGYERVECAKGSFGDYLRKLPLKGRGSKLYLYDGRQLSNLQFLNYAVIDQPLLSNYEQCADVCMRFRAEYLYAEHRYADIHFQDVNNKRMQYHGGASRSSFEKYMRQVYGMASTYSLVREMKPRKLQEVKPGDVLVYAARPGRRYGHAVQIVDVARDKHGRIAVLLAEGNTPARDKHVIRNNADIFASPWFFLSDDDDKYVTMPFVFNKDELRCW